MAITLLIQAVHFEKLQAKRLALGEHPVECGLVGQHAGQHRVLAQGTSLKRGKGGAERLTQAAADTDRAPPAADRRARRSCGGHP